MLLSLNPHSHSQSHLFVCAPSFALLLVLLRSFIQALHITIMTRYIFSSLWCLFFDYFSFIWLSFIFRFCGRSIFFTSSFSFSSIRLFLALWCSNERIVVLNCVRVAAVFLVTIVGKTLCIYIYVWQKLCAPQIHLTLLLPSVYIHFHFISLSLRFHSILIFVGFFLFSSSWTGAYMNVFTMCSFLRKFIIVTGNKGKFT